MSILQCDVCGSTLVMNAGGANATCSNCGISYSVERLKEKINFQSKLESGEKAALNNGAQDNEKSLGTSNPATVQFMVNVAESVEELQFLGKKYLKRCDWDNAEKIYDKLLDRIPDDENAVEIFNNIKIWKSMEIENGVLKRYTGKFSKVVIPEAVTSIGPRSFIGNRSVQTVVVPENVENIERDAFSQCRELRKVSGMANVRFIGKSAFFECPLLEEVELGNHIEYIGDDAFRGCTSLKAINLPESLKQLERGAFKGCASLTEVSIPSGVETITASLFELCKNLEKVSLPENLRAIETNAFYGCKALKNLNLPSKLQELHCACFKDTGLETVELPEGISELPVQCFDRCEELTHITLPQSITKLCDKAFYGCVKLVTLELNKQVKIGRQVFWNCKKLMYVNPQEKGGAGSEVVLLDLTSPESQNVDVLPVDLFLAFKGTPYYNSEILRRRSNKLCDRCAGKLGFFGKCKVCGYKRKGDKI